MSSQETAPRIVVIAGPNGAGKTTSANALLQGSFAVSQYINADIIEAESGGALSSFAAGRIMLDRVRTLARQRVSFAFETTLASRTFVPWLAAQSDAGYEIKLIFLWIPSVEAAIARVQERVRRGGHNIPPETIQRRYRAGLRNFFDLYQVLAQTWQVFDNSLHDPTLVAAGTSTTTTTVANELTWKRIVESIQHD